MRRTPNQDPIQRRGGRIILGVLAGTLLLDAAVILTGDSSPNSRTDAEMEEASLGGFSEIEKARLGVKQKELQARLAQAPTKEGKITILLEEGCRIEDSPLVSQFYYSDLLDTYGELMGLDIGPDQTAFRQALIAAGCPQERMPHQIIPRGGHEHH